MIYEGTNGVQAMDLVGRKLAQNGGRAVQAFFKLVGEEAAVAKGDEDRISRASWKRRFGELQAATMWFMGQGMQNPDQVGAGAHPYMHLMGIVALGLMWLRMAEVAHEALAAGDADTAFLEAKLVTARYFADRVMPEAGALRRKIEGGSEAMMALPPEMFAAG